MMSLSIEMRDVYWYVRVNYNIRHHGNEVTDWIILTLLLYLGRGSLIPGLSLLFYSIQN